MAKKNKDSELLPQLLQKLNEVVTELQEIKAYVAVSAFLESQKLENDIGSQDDSTSL